MIFVDRPLPSPTVPRRPPPQKNNFGHFLTFIKYWGTVGDGGGRLKKLIYFLVLHDFCGPSPAVPHRPPPSPTAKKQFWTLFNIYKILGDGGGRWGTLEKIDLFLGFT